MAAPKLEGDAARAVAHRGGHMQIIACAGSGKTEVVSQRVVDLLAGGAAPRSIVAFTFTEKAATGLKDRITHRVAERLGKQSLDLLSGLYVGTIHAYCFQFLQRYVPRYEAYDVLDDNQLTAFLAREANRLEIKQLGGGMFASISTFLKSVDVIANELLDPESMPDPFRTVLLNYLATLDRYHLLTYGQLIARAVAALEGSTLRAEVHEELRYLIVDEYQDVNPAQERLIELLVGPDTELCVVGDDDQAIYQWRGSDVANIVDFADRYPGVATFSLTTNRRSRPTIIERADTFARTIPDRLPKSMRTYRDAGGYQEIVAWESDTEIDEVEWIVSMIADLHRRGLPFGDIAILVRTRAAYARLVEALAAEDIPVQPGGRTGLFRQPEAMALGKVIAWLSDVAWKDGPGFGTPVTDADLFAEIADVFALDGPGRRRAEDHLRQWKNDVPAGGSCRRPGRRAVRPARPARSLGVGSVGPVGCQPVRHTRTVLGTARGLRVGASSGAARRQRPRRTGRRAGQRQLVLLESRHAHHQLRGGQLRGLRRRARPDIRRHRAHDRPPSEGAGMAGRVRCVPDEKPLPDVHVGATAELAGPARAVQHRAVRGR